MTAPPQDLTDRRRLVTWEDPAPILAAGATQSGLEVLQAIARGELPAPPISSLLNLSIASVEEGSVVFAMEPGEEQLNPLGTIHGGIISALLDSAMGCSLHTLLPVGTSYTTLELKVNFVRPVRPDHGTVQAAGKVIHRGRTVATTEAHMTSADGKLLAHATSTLLLFGAT